MKILLSLILMISFASCNRNNKDIGTDELDLEREEEYSPDDFSEREINLSN